MKSIKTTFCLSLSTTSLKGLSYYTVCNLKEENSCMFNDFSSIIKWFPYSSMHKAPADPVVWGAPWVGGCQTYRILKFVVRIS